MKLNIATICKHDLRGNTLEVNLSYSAYLLALDRKKALWGRISFILHTLSVFAGGWGWIIYGFAMGIEKITDIPLFVWLSIIIFPLTPFLLDVIFAIFTFVQKSVLARNCTEFVSDGDLSASLGRLEQNLQKVKAYNVSYNVIITYVAMGGFMGVSILFLLWAFISDFNSSSEAQSTEGNILIIVLGVCLVGGLITFMYSGVLMYADSWFERIFYSEKDSNNISRLRSSYPAYAEHLRFEAMPPEEQQRILKEREAYARRREEEEKRRNDMVAASMAGWTWSPTDSSSTGGLTGRDHDILDDLGRAGRENWSKDM